MRFLYVLCFLGVFFTSCEKKKTLFSSPDEQIQLQFLMDQDGIPYYSILYKEDTLIRKSRLGLHLDGNPMDSALHFISQQIQLNKSSLRLPQSESDSVQGFYNEMVVKVEKDHREMDIVFRLYNHGVGIRYWIRGYENVVISGKQTEVNFADEPNTYWSCPEDEKAKYNYYRGSFSMMREAFSTTFPEVYPDSMFLNFPFLVQSGNKYMNFQLVSGYNESQYKLKLDPDKNSVSTYVYKGAMSEMVVTLPFYSQWLVIGIAGSSSDLLESRVVYYLNMEEDLPKEKIDHPIALYENNCNNNVILPFSSHYEGREEYTLLNMEDGAYSTLAHQLGLHIVFNRPLLDYKECKKKGSCKSVPYEFVRELPRHWDSCQVIDGELGRYVITARKDAHSDNWFVGGITNCSGYESNLVLDFLPREKLYKATIYEDGESADWLDNPKDYKVTQMYVRHGASFSYKMAKGGGFAISLKEVKNP